MSPFKRFLIHTVLAASVVSAAAVTTSARQDVGLAPYEGPTKERTRDDNERDLENRVAYQRLLAAWAANRRERKKADPRLAFAQLQEDFTRLQLVNKDLVLTTSRSPALDLKFVAKSAAEINRRGARLMSNLALPEPPGDERPKRAAMSGPAEVKKAITALGWLIYNFAKNPIFGEVDVVEVKSAAKARHDLEEIIELSEQLKKSSEQLEKAARKSP